jgi:transcriptional regulator with GAF, ATPase, and Fis domain
MRAMDGEVLVQGDDPQVLWLAKLRPATRLTRPMPEDLAAVDAELEARLSNDFEHEEPRIIVTSPAISNGKATSTARRLGYDREFLVQRYEIAATRDGWSLWTPKQ